MVCNRMKQSRCCELIDKGNSNFVSEKIFSPRLVWFGCFAQKLDYFSNMEQQTDIIKLLPEKRKRFLQQNPRFKSTLNVIKAITFNYFHSNISEIQTNWLYQQNNWTIVLKQLATRLNVMHSSNKNNKPRAMSASLIRNSEKKMRTTTQHQFQQSIHWPLQSHSKRRNIKTLQFIIAPAKIGDD